MHYLFIKIAHKFCGQINSMSQTATKLSFIGSKTYYSIFEQFNESQHFQMLSVGESEI